MQSVAQGGTGTFTAVFETGAGDLVDPTSPAVDVIDANGIQVVTDATPTRVSLGNYSYAYVVPSDGALGVWQLHWTGTISGLNAGGDDFFDVVTPGSILTSSYDLLTLDEAKAALNITSGSQFDDELAMYVTAVSQRIDDHCGPVVKRSVTGEVHDGGDAFVFLNLTPVATVGSVTEWANGTSTALSAETLNTSGDYIFTGAGTHNSMLRRRSGWHDRWFATGQGNIVVNYVAGRFDSTAAVSPKFKQAAAKTLSWLWKGDQGSGSTTFGALAEGTSLFGLGFALPNVVLEMLAFERKPPAIA